MIMLYLGISWILILWAHSDLSECDHKADYISQLSLGCASLVDSLNKHEQKIEAKLADIEELQWLCFAHESIDMEREHKWYS